MYIKDKTGRSRSESQSCFVRFHQQATQDQCGSPACGSLCCPSRPRQALCFSFTVSPACLSLLSPGSYCGFWLAPWNPPVPSVGQEPPSASLAAGEHDGGRFESGSLFVRLNFIPQPVSEKTCRATSSLRNTARWFSVTCGRGLELMIRISRWVAFVTFVSHGFHRAFCAVKWDSHFCHDK